MADQDETEIPDEKEDRPDREETAKLTGVYIDSYWLTIWNELIRISFGEALGGKVRYRSAVVMPWEDAESLARQILSMVEKRRKRTKTAATAPPEPAEKPKS